MTRAPDILGFRLFSRISSSIVTFSGVACFAARKSPAYLRLPHGEECQWPSYTKLVLFLQFPTSFCRAPRAEFFISHFPILYVFLRFLVWILQLHGHVFIPLALYHLYLYLLFSLYPVSCFLHFPPDMRYWASQKLPWDMYNSAIATEFSSFSRALVLLLCSFLFCYTGFFAFLLWYPFFHSLIACVQYLIPPPTQMYIFNNPLID